MPAGGCDLARAGRTHPAAPLVDVGGQGVERVDIVHAAGVLDVLAGHDPRGDGGQHRHQQLGEPHRETDRARLFELSFLKRKEKRKTQRHEPLGDNNHEKKVKIVVHKHNGGQGASPARRRPGLG